MDRPVWVDLKRLFHADQVAAPAQLADSLVDLDRPAEGVLVEWRRGARGQWLAVVNYSITSLAGQPQAFSRQLVPAEAVRPRTVGAYPGEGPW